MGLLRTNRAANVNHPVRNHPNREAVVDYVATKFEELIKERGITLGKLEDMTGHARGTLAACLRRERMPNVDTLITVCVVMEVAPWELLPTSTDLEEIFRGWKERN